MSAATSRVRLGAVPFLNAKPLVFGLERGIGRERIELRYDVPSLLAERLAAGELDAALLPSIELARIPGLVVVPGISISARGPAASVLLVCRKPLREVRSVALDPESRTSNALAQVLFRDVWGTSPEFSPGPAELETALEDHDAAVRIGDKALFEPVPAGMQALDLGAAWSQAHGLPFVFAVWAARPAVLDRELYDALHRSKRQGFREVEAIALGYTWRGRQDPLRSLAYLTHNMSYRLGEPEVRSLERFLARAWSAGLVDREPDVSLASFGAPACGTAEGARPRVLAKEAE